MVAGPSARSRHELRDVVRSVREHGILQPVLVAPAGDDYALIAGHRRIAAAAKLGLVEIPAFVREPSEGSDGLELALVENMARVDLDPVEEALAFQRLIDRGLTRRGVAQTLGVSQRLVTERLQVLELPEEVRPKVATGRSPRARSRRSSSWRRSTGSCPRWPQARGGAAGPQVGRAHDLGGGRRGPDPRGLRRLRGR